MSVSVGLDLQSPKQGFDSTGRQDLKICNFWYPLKLVAPATLSAGISQRNKECIEEGWISLITYFTGANVLHEMLLL